MARRAEMKGPPVGARGQPRSVYFPYGWWAALERVAQRRNDESPGEFRVSRGSLIREAILPLIEDELQNGSQG